MGLEFDHERIPLYKLILHSAQILIAVTIWVLEIIVFKGGDINGRNGWVFGLCFLSVPAWIFLIMAPRHSRARRIADPKAMMVFDFIFTVMWLSAFATQAAYNTANHCGSACGPSKAIVGLGIFETLFWAASTLVSFATYKYYNFNGVLPGYETGRGPRTTSIDPDKAAFSTAPADEEAYAPVGVHDHDDEPEFNASPYGGMGMGSDPNSHSAHGANPYAADTAYGGAAAVQSQQTEHYAAHTSPAPPAGGHLYAPPAAADDFDDRPAVFPSADYSRGGILR